MTPTDLAALLAELARIKAYCEAATLGPWLCWDGNPLPEGVRCTVEHALYRFQQGDNHVASLVLYKDAIFIANARTDLPRLITALEQMVRERDALKAELEKWKLAYDDAYIAWKKQRGLV